MSRYILPVVAAAGLALAKTDIEGCTSITSTVTVRTEIGYGNTYETVIWYVPDTLEICRGVDCGGGRAPPRKVPGCPMYSGTETVTASFLSTDPAAPHTKMSKPTVILVHGAWHSPAHYREFLDILEKKGYPETIQKVADQGKEIIGIAHSYGGIIATETFAGFGVKARAAEGKAGGVKWLVYCCAFIMEGNETMYDIAPPELLLWQTVEGSLICFTQGYDMGALFYSDLSKEDQQKWAGLMTRFPKACANYATKRKAYEGIGTTYIYCEEDALFSVVAQRILVGRVRERGFEIKEESLPAGHFPMLSMPDRLAEIIFKLPLRGSKL
ncbi:hypothetical protein K4K57_006220 [Colletotrichum sp. SAR 10_99]|nr:hypothetical protein K4K57_006220 [Colletotrichum sp. SAR 10_99]